MSRLIAWNDELLKAHQRLREALRVARASVNAGDAASARSDLALYCHGFCVALGAHHVGEDTVLFPVLSERYPELRKMITLLTQDHDMIATLLADFDRAVSSGADVDALDRHLTGLAAIMESHFKFEERKLLEVLEGLSLDADPRVVFGGL